MLVSTKGIVIHAIDYSETSIICKIYTQQLGLQSYMIKGVRKKNARLKRNLFSPLNIIHLIANHKEREGLTILRDAVCDIHFNTISTNMTKRAICLYMSEMLSRSITSQMQDANLFEFIEKSILQLEDNSDVSTFPLCFALNLSGRLGFAPLNNYSQENKFFNLMEGVFCKNTPIHSYYLETEASTLLSELLTTINAGITIPKFNYHQRNELLNSIHSYFRLHIPSFGEVKSVIVLKEILKD